MIDRLDVRSVRLPAMILLAAGGLWLVLQQLAELGMLTIFPPLAVLLAVGLVIARYPWTSFAMLVMTVPFQRLGSEGTVLPVTLTQLMFPIAVAGCLVALFAERRRARGHVTLLPFALLIAIMVASSFRASSPGDAWPEIARWVVAFVAMWIALQFVVGSSERRLIGFVALLAAGGVFESTIGVVQSVIGFGPFEVSSGVSRAFGTFGRPNSYAGYLEMTLFPTVALTIWYAKESLERYRIYATERLQGMAASRKARLSLARAVIALIAFSGSAVVILSGVAASLSRGAWLGVAFGAFATAMLLGPVVRLIGITAAFFGAAFLLGGQAGFVPESYQERISESINQFGKTEASNVPITADNFATLERLAHWQTGLNMYRDHPALGVGVGNFNPRFEEYSIREEFRISQGHAHNYYIHTLAETGLIGLLLYLSLLLSIIFIALRVLLARTAQGTLARMIVLGAFGSIIAVATHNLFENLHVLNLGIVISLLWALVIAGHELWRDRELQPV
ncbi:O-antigen ligase family protein [soil metagenome]